MLVNNTYFEIIRESGHRAALLDHRQEDIPKAVCYERMLYGFTLSTNIN